MTRKKTDYGIYTEGIWNLHPVTLTTGLRYDHFKYTAANGQNAANGQLNPSVGIIWDVNDNFSLLGNLNQASRSPRLNEALLANERAGNAVDVDKDLKAETARRAEIGFKWQQNGFNLSGSIFHQNIKDLVVYQWAKIDNKKAVINERGRIFQRRQTDYQRLRNRCILSKRRSDRTFRGILRQTAFER